ncbi:hypothetical protein RDWZM_009900 [Blomia tropicalis]|uniref:Uncharacterized protein n=1 Tax=Blomia tropicalis TaxID=40697 RepID=A0A9Q0LXG4_BLOTA|nr:hypothetical protein RDWZM_009900 [Blomia tropicalis]
MLWGNETNLHQQLNLNETKKCKIDDDDDEDEDEYDRLFEKFNGLAPPFDEHQSDESEQQKTGFTVRMMMIKYRPFHELKIERRQIGQ